MMHISKLLWCVIIMFSSATATLSQMKHDAHFVMGYWSDSGFQDPILHFGPDSVNITYRKLPIGFDIASSNISDRNGNLLFYFNGCDLANHRHEIMDNGTGFNPGQIATRYCSGNDGYPSVYQSFLSLPLEDDGNEFIILHNSLDYISENNKITLYGIPRYSIVDMKSNNGRGKVTIKNQIYLPDTTIDGGKLTAVRHANNKDWWIVALDNDGTNRYYKALLQDHTIALHSIQEIGLLWQNTGGGQSGFSSDGRKYFRYTATDGLSIMDFDRETGLFSNYRYFPTTQEYLFGGASFSPNGRFVYISHGPSLVQIDTDDEVMVADTVAKWDGKASTWGQPAWFGYMQLGPDCRIYMTTGFCIPFMHVIMKPDEKGKACEVRQHMLEFDVPICNLPYFPNYRLGTEYEFCNPEIVVVSSTHDVGLQEAYLPKYKLYPNPASDKVTLYSTDMRSLNIYNAQGSQVSQIKLDGQDEYVLDISDLQAGVYFVKIVFGSSSQEEMMKLIKVK